MPTEKSITDGIKRELKSQEWHGLWWLKYHGHATGKVGVPDLLVFYRGYFIPLEVKTDEGKVSKNQDRELKALDLAEALPFVVRSRAEVKEILEWVRELPLRVAPAPPEGLPGLD